MTAPRITPRMSKERRDELEKLADEDPHMCLVREMLNEIDALSAELDRLHADGMPRDREELQKLLNDAYRTGNQEAHEAHRLVREMGLSAQGGEVPDLTDDEIDSRIYRQPAGPCDDEDWARWSHRECRWAYHLALSRVRPHVTPAPPHPDTVEVLQRFVDWCEHYPSSRIYSYGEIAGIARIMDEIHADAKRALRAQAQPATERTIDHA